MNELTQEEKDKVAAEVRAEFARAGGKTKNEKMTPEERKAWSEKMNAAKAKKKEQPS